MGKILRRPAVLEKTGLSNMQIYRLEERGLFPKRVQLGPNSVGWLEAEIDDWIKGKAAARDNPARLAA